MVLCPAPVLHPDGGLLLLFVVVYIFSEFVQQYPCLPSCTLYKHILKSLYKNTY